MSQGILYLYVNWGYPPSLGEALEILELLALDDDARFLGMAESDNSLLTRAVSLGGERLVTALYPPDSPGRTRHVLTLCLVL